MRRKNGIIIARQPAVLVWDRAIKGQRNKNPGQSTRDFLFMSFELRCNSHRPRPTIWPVSASLPSGREAHGSRCSLTCTLGGDLSPGAVVLLIHQIKRQSAR